MIKLKNFSQSISRHLITQAEKVKSTLETHAKFLYIFNVEKSLQRQGKKGFQKVNNHDNKSFTVPKYRHIIVKPCDSQFSG